MIQREITLLRVKAVMKVNRHLYQVTVLHLPDTNVIFNIRRGILDYSYLKETIKIGLKLDSGRVKRSRF